jgi:hypothetical protein
VRRLVAGGNELRHWRISWLAAAVMSLATPIRYYSPSFFDRTAAATNGGVTGRDQSVRDRMINAARSHPPPLMATRCSCLVSSAGRAGTS